MKASKSYTHPAAFAPERWLPDSSPYVSASSPRVLRKDAFLPFSTGPMGCVGKGLALQELRMLIAVLLDRFEPAFAKGEDGNELLVHSKDWFTLGLGRLELCFRGREV
jgi:cytochrome P450